LVWLNFPTAYSFVMISPNLHAIWVFLLMYLSQDLKCFLLIYFGTLGDGYSLKGSNKKPSQHNFIYFQLCDQIFIFHSCYHMFAHRERIILSFLIYKSRVCQVTAFQTQHHLFLTMKILNLKKDLVKCYLIVYFYG
jgi:hypothetical protein